MEQPQTTWLQAAIRGAAVVYGPQLVGAVFSPLFEDQHCVNTFFKLFPLIPGLLVMGLTRLHGTPGLGLAALVSLGVLTGATLLTKRWTTPRIGGAILVGIGSALNAWIVAHLIRA